MRARLLAVAGLLLAASAGAAVPQRVNYQGKLADAAGDPLSGTYSFRFKLFAAETGGAALFSEDVTGANAQSVVNGIYSVQIGSYTAGGIPYGVFDGQDLYLEIDVNAGNTLTGAETLSPRERLSAAAWAVHALGAERLGTGAVVATFTAAGAFELPSGSTISAGGTLTLSTAASAASTGDPALFISRTGEVGVGTSQPGTGTVKLRVAGNLQVDNELVASAPTAANDPSYTFMDDNDSGMYQPAIDQVAFAAGGVEALRLRGLGGTAYALATSSGVNVGAGPVYLNTGGFIRFPDGTTLASASGAGSNYVTKTGDTMTGQLTINGSSLTVVHSGNAQGFVLAATSATDRSSYHLYVATTGGVGMGRAGEPTSGSRLDVAGPLFVGGTPGSLFLGGGGWPYSIGVGWNGQNDTLRFNAVGTGGGTADFRDLIVYDGKTNPIAAFDGSTARFGVNTTAPGSDVDVFRPAGSYPTFRLSDGNVTLPDYSGSSSVGEVSLSNAVLHIKSNRGGSGTNATGGALFQGFTEAGVNNWVPLHLVGTHGGTSPTSAAVTISGQKHSGGNNRSALAGAEPVLDVETNYGGTLLMRVEGGGRVGVGVSAPAARLHVSSPAAAGDTVLHVSSGAAADKPLLTVKGDGAVGIGTANPGYPLDVYRSGDAAVANLQGGGNAWNYSGFNLWSDEATDKYWALFHRKAAGEANNLLLEEFDGTAYKQRMVMKPDGTSSFTNSTTKTQFELQGAGDAFNYTSFVFYNNDWTKYWAWLHRKGAGETNNFFLEEFDGVAYNARIAFEPGGNVGIGTTDPVAKLHVSSADASTSVRIVNRDSSTNRFPSVSVYNYKGTTNFGGAPQLNLVSARGTQDAPSAVQANDPLAGISVWGQYDASNIGQNAGIYVHAGGNFSATSRPTEMRFRTTATGATAAVDNLALTGDGRLGVGTTNPVAKLDVSTDSAVNDSTVTVISIGHTTSGTPAPGIGARLDFRAERSDGNMSVPGFIAGLFTDVTAGSEDGDLVFGTILNSAGTGAERMRITSAGDLGVGTTSPGAKLGVTQAAAGQMGIRVEMPTAAENTSPGIRVKGYSPAIELMDKDNVQNWYLGIDDNDSNKLLIGRGYGPGQGVTQAITIDTSDRVGIGTTGPGAPLHVVASGVEPAYITTSGSDGTLSILSLYGSGGTDREFFFNNAGNAAADGTWGTGADYAEYFRSEDATLKPQELVCLAGNKRVARCAAGGTLIGVVSTKPGILGVVADDVTDAIEAYEKDPRWVKVALMGQVPTKVSVKSGRIKAGMQLKPGEGGVAVAGSSPRTLLVLALEDSDEDGSILTLIK